MLEVLLIKVEKASYYPIFYQKWWPFSYEHIKKMERFSDLFGGSSWGVQ